MADNDNNSPEHAGSGYEAARQLIEGAKIVGLDGSTLDPDDVAFDVEAMNEFYALVLMGGRPLILEENFKRGDCPVEERLNFMPIDALHAWFANQLHRLSQEKSVSWSKMWFQNPQRRQYRGVCFAPGMMPPGGYYNLWRGFSYRGDAEDSEKKCDIFLDHVRTNIAGGNEAHFNFIIGWAAHMLQKPTDRIGIAIVMRGGQGTGKTVFGRAIGKLIEDHYALVDDPRYVTGNFNAHLASTLLLQADEGFWAGDKHAEGRLKGLVTSDYHMIERKGVDPFRVRNYVHLLVTSNNDWVVPAGHDERRFAVFDVGSHAQQNRQYFAAMHDQLENGGYEALLGYLLNFDLDSVDLNDIPKTAALADQKLASLSSEEAWWLTCLRRGFVQYNSEGGSAMWSDYVAVEEAYGNYLAWVTARGRRFPMTEEMFGRAINKLVPDMQKGRKRIGGVRKYVYHMPRLDACRQAFSDMIRTPIDWSEADFDEDIGPDDF